MNNTEKHQKDVEVMKKFINIARTFTDLYLDTSSVKKLSPLMEKSVERFEDVKEELHKDFLRIKEDVDAFETKLIKKLNFGIHELISDSLADGLNRENIQESQHIKQITDTYEKKIENLLRIIAEKDCVISIMTRKIQDLEISEKPTEPETPVESETP